DRIDLFQPRLLQLHVLAARDDVQMTATAVEPDRVGAGVQPEGARRGERPGIEELDPVAPVGNQQALRLRDEKDAVGRIEAADAPQMPAGTQIEYLERAVILGREEETIDREVDGEVIEIARVPAQIRATLQHANSVRAGAARRREACARAGCGGER